MSASRSELELEKRYEELRTRIRAAAPEREVTLVAVSKTHPTSAIEALYNLGHRDFGENYVQELVTKANELRAKGLDDIRWHFIGHLQTNKVKLLIPHVSCVHSVNSEKLAQELAKRWRAADRPGQLPVFLEVNIDEEPSKSGADPQSTVNLAKRIGEALSNELSLQGLMCIPELESGMSGDAFEKLRNLEHQCRPSTQGQLSMGMTQDFEIALRHGATHIRVGTALFGDRPQKIYCDSDTLKKSERDPAEPQNLR